MFEHVGVVLKVLRSLVFRDSRMAVSRQRNLEQPPCVRSKGVPLREAQRLPGDTPGSSRNVQASLRERVYTMGFVQHDPLPTGIRCMFWI